MKSENIPNAITGSRIVFALSLFFVEPFSVGFIILYLLCGFSDFLDGFIARNIGKTSQKGAMFDTIADIVFIGVMLAIFIPILSWKSWMIEWACAIALIKLTSMGIGFIKYHEIASSLHTVSNKFTGVLLFCFPLFYIMINLNTIVFILCGIATISSFEELMIMVKAKILDRNVHSIFDIGHVYTDR